MPIPESGFRSVALSSPAGPNEATCPSLVVGVHGRCVYHKELDCAVRVGPLADEPRGEHLGVVHYEQVVRRDVLDDVGDMPVLDDARRAVEHHHLLGAALFGRVLSYQPFGKRIPELPCLHNGSFLLSTRTLISEALKKRIGNPAHCPQPGDT